MHKPPAHRTWAERGRLLAGAAAVLAMIIVANLASLCAYMIVYLDDGSGIDAHDGPREPVVLLVTLKSGLLSACTNLLVLLVAGVLFELAEAQLLTRYEAHRTAEEAANATEVKHACFFFASDYFVLIHTGHLSESHLRAARSGERRAA